MNQSFYLYTKLSENRGILLAKKAVNQLESSSPQPENLTTDLIVFMLGEIENLGITGNTWQQYITYLLITDENPFSLSCEWQVDPTTTLYNLAKTDLKAIYDLFHLDWQGVNPTLQNILTNYEAKKTSRPLDSDMLDLLIGLTKALNSCNNCTQFTKTLANHYNQVGVGNLGMYKGFRVGSFAHLGEITPIYNPALSAFSDLIGYHRQKSRLIENTQSFIEGKTANNVMLYGDSGTGKSTSIRAILNQFKDKKLKMIELHKHQFKYIPIIIRSIKSRNYYFILCLDDLSFEENEVEYKYLKAVIEGGLELRPANVLIYATSNRRHLIREQWKDRTDFDTEVHSSDTMEEKLSLAYRFGISIFFPSPTSVEFKEIVLSLADRNGIIMEEDKLLLKAHRWELRNGGITGRTAKQFIDYIKGSQ